MRPGGLRMTEFPSARIEIHRATRSGVSAGLHVAIVMDGHERWALQRNLPRAFGHCQGAEAARRTIKCAADNGIAHLTLFGFLSENWNRPTIEEQHLTGLLRHYLQTNVAEWEEGGIRLSVIGEREDLPSDCVALIEEAERRTLSNTGLHLTIALNYGGRADIVSGARRLALQVQAGTIAPRDIDEVRFGAGLSTWFLPDPDLMIRTGGEQRLGNFLLWQLAYAEMIFTDKYWPDFTGEDLAAAISEFRRRDRRFGAIQTDVLASNAILR